MKDQETESFLKNSNSQEDSSDITKLGDINRSNNDDENQIDFNDLFLLIKRRRKLILGAGSLAFILIIFYTSIKRIVSPVYQGYFTLLVTDPITNSNSGSQNGKSIFEDLALNNNSSNDIPTLIKLLESPVLLSPLAKKFDLNPIELSERIEITQPSSKGRRRQEQGIVYVNLFDTSKKKGLILLTALSETYLSAALEQKQKRLASGLEFLRSEEPILEKKTQELQSELAAFRENYNLLEPTAEGLALKERVTKLEDKILKLEIERYRLENVKEQIIKGTLSARGFQIALNSGASFGPSNEGLSVSGREQSLLNELLNVESQLAEARSKYKPTSNMIIGLEERLSKLKPIFEKNQIEATEAALTINRELLKTTKFQRDELNELFLKQPALIEKYASINQKLIIAQENLSGLVSAREKFQLEMAQRSIPWQVISEPRFFDNIFKPSLKNYLGFGLIFSSFFALAAGFIRDKFDHVYHTSDEVKESLKKPLIGHIPYVSIFKDVRKDKQSVFKILDDDSKNLTKESKYQRFFYQEALRSIYASILLTGVDNSINIFSITSSCPLEGKSIANLLLAQTFSEFGKKVLLIDADLRKPQLHYRTGLNNIIGLSNYLTDQSVEWEDAIQKIPDNENLNILTAGQIPPNPSKLLNSRKMEKFVQKLRKSGKYDFVIFDTPPVLGLADSTLLSKFCDGIILLVGLNSVDRSLPKNAISQIIKSKVNFLGVITNEVKYIKDNKRSRYGYEYQYGYDTAYVYNYYGLTEDDSKEIDKDQGVNNSLVNKIQKKFEKVLKWIDN